MTSLKFLKKGNCKRQQMKILLYTLGTLIVLSILSILIKQRSQKVVPPKYIDYQDLFKGTIESENYELLKIFEHYCGDRMIDGINYFKRAFKDTLTTNTILIYSLVEYEKHKNRWIESGPCYVFLKIDNKGRKIDSLNAGNHLANDCGVFFFEETYMDWINNGDKTKKNYHKIIDADLLSESKFDGLVSAAQEISIAKDYDNQTALIYLKNKHGWSLLKSKKHVDKIEYKMGLFHTWTLKPYLSDSKERFIEKPYYNSRVDTNSDHTNFIVTEHFIKKVKHKSSLGDFNNHRRVGWSGTGYFKLSFDSESMYFKAPAFNNWIENTSIYFTDSKTQDFVLIQINNKNDKESGTYVLRKK